MTRIAVGCPERSCSIFDKITIVVGGERPGGVDLFRGTSAGAAAGCTFRADRRRTDRCRCRRRKSAPCRPTLPMHGWMHRYAASSATRAVVFASSDRSATVTLRPEDSAKEEAKRSRYVLPWLFCVAVKESPSPTICQESSTPGDAAPEGGSGSLPGSGLERRSDGWTGCPDLRP